MKLLEVFIGSVIRPYHTFNLLAHSPTSLTMGWVFTLGFSLLYSLTALFLATGGWEPNPDFPPFLPIPIENYYLYQSLFTIPVGIAGIGLINLMVFGISRQFGAKVSIGGLWGPISIAATVPFFFFTWLPETFFHAFQPPGTILINAQVEAWRQIIAVAWSTILLIVAVKASSSIHWWQSIVTGLLAIVALVVFMLVFLR